MTTYFLVNLRGKLNSNHVRNLLETQKRSLSYEEICRKRNRIFDFEQKKQRENVGRVEKIEVRYLGTPNDATMVMNKNLSTPFNVAQHISETKCKSSVIALVDNKKLWDMHRPLEESCTLQLLNFRMTDPFAVNHAFWRSCSFLLGAVMQRTFKEAAGLQLHSFPKPNIKSGSFVHDICLKDGNWQPSEQDLHTLRIEMVKIASEALRFERLEVTHEIAMEMFKDNPFKREQLPNISSQSNGQVTLYRVGEHIDISRGPMISNTSFVGRNKIAAVHKIPQPSDTHNLYRVQGVALPTGFNMSAFAFDILTDRASKLNTRISTPHHEETEDDHHTPIIQRSAN